MIRGRLLKKCLLLNLVVMIVVLTLLLNRNVNLDIQKVPVERRSKDYSISRRILVDDLHQDSPGADTHDDGRNSTSSDIKFSQNHLKSSLQRLTTTESHTKSLHSNHSPQHSPSGKNSIQQDASPSQPVYCVQSHCKEHLSRRDSLRMSSCFQELMKSNKKLDPIELKSRILENNCRFMNGWGRHPVALASAEGSGNTWVRGLLEKASGICTGFNFCDYMMRMKGFIGENINSGSVLVVKTHTDNPQWTGPGRPFNKHEARYGSGIFLLRNPYDSLVAEWNRRLTNFVMIKRKMPHNESHTNVAPKEIWFSEDWDKFIQSYMTAWKKRIEKWVLQEDPAHPVLVVRYEDLKTDTVKEVERMLVFLNQLFDPDQLPDRLAEDYTTFKRAHDVEFERYTGQQKLYVESILLETLSLAHYSNMTRILRLDDYFLNK